VSPLHRDATEVRDYGAKEPTEGWLASDDHDPRIIEQSQRGATSPAYEAQPDAPVQEGAVMQFVRGTQREPSIATAELPRRLRKA
jgi:hypothetical protein